MKHGHALLYIDHTGARIFFPDAAEDTVALLAHKVEKRFDGHRQSLERPFLNAVVDKLHGINELLLVGPGAAKVELKKFLEDHHADVAKHVVGVMTVDHPTEGELKAFALDQFKRIDQWR